MSYNTKVRRNQTRGVGKDCCWRRGTAGKKFGAGFKTTGLLKHGGVPQATTVRVPLGFAGGESTATASILKISVEPGGMVPTWRLP